MSNLEVNEVNPEQSITEYGYKNIRQFDLTAFYNEHLIASLWQDEDENWHLTKRLYNIKTDEEIKAERAKIINIVTEKFGEVEVIDSFFESAPHDAKPLQNTNREVFYRRT